MAIMNAKDVLSGSLADCYVTIDNKRYKFMQATKIEAKVTKNKAEVSILGKTGKGNKATGWKGTGSATFHYNTSIFRKVMEDYKDTGKDVYFEMHIINGDKTSAAGNQEVFLYGCNIDSMIIAKFDAGSDTLSEDMDFTFEDYKMKSSFSLLAGMVE